ncbi:hypothetical protein AOQ84DRAFT_205019 [Glonium stellatum]|uniref:C2H2-type domain-containing protein n=1 Tax=Glonium stellatum TaxID=574774 RepID=A0A8E2F5L7_9PEZI|nr:hypothetical protein AOQ84DRAFT_205019 [Glonium stellatum]
MPNQPPNWERTGHSDPSYDNINHSDDHMPTAYNPILPQRAHNYPPQTTGYQNAQGYFAQAQTPQASSRAAAPWSASGNYSRPYSPGNAHTYQGPNSGAQGATTPIFTVSEPSRVSPSDQAQDGNRSPTSLNTYQTGFHSLSGGARAIDDQAPSSPIDYQQTHSTNIYPPGGRSYPQYSYSYDDAPVWPEQSQGHNDALLPSPGAEKSTPISRSNSRSGRMSYTCGNDECTASFTRQADLQRHQSTVHSKEKPFPCNVKNCTRVGERGFSRRDHLIEHLRSYHAIDIPKRKPGQRTAQSNIPFN